MCVSSAIDLKLIEDNNYVLSICVLSRGAHNQCPINMSWNNFAVTYSALNICYYSNELASIYIYLTFIFSYCLFCLVDGTLTESSLQKLIENTWFVRVAVMTQTREEPSLVSMYLQHNVLSVARITALILISHSI